MKRQLILELDSNMCQVWGCGNPYTLEIHHIIPRSQGGSDKPENTITLCNRHHSLITLRRMTDIEVLEKLVGRANFRWQKALEWHRHRAKIRKNGNAKSNSVPRSS